MAEATPGEVPQFKSQPWTVFDTIVSKSFLIGDTANPAVGTQVPAINNNGQMVWFSAGRQEPNVPWYTNTQLNGQLSYGFEAWQAYMKFNLPPVVSWNSNAQDIENGGGADQGGTPPALLLAHAIANFGVVTMTLGQEQQFSWPAGRFAAGGGLHISGGVLNPVVQNSMPQNANILKLPEAIEIPRTQPLDVKLTLAPEARDLVGTVAAPGVGAPFCPYGFILCTEDGDEGPEFTPLQLPMTPFSVEFGFMGRRIKHTQYGQVPSA